MTEVKLINIQRLLEAAEYLERRERGEYKFVLLKIREKCRVKNLCIFVDSIFRFVIHSFLGVK